MTDTILGIVIGSGMTLGGVVLQGLISWFLCWRKDVRDGERQKLVKREMAYRDFVNFYGAVLAAAGTVISSTDMAARLPVANLYLQPQLLEKLSDILSGVQIYGSPNVAALASSFVKDYAEVNLRHEPMTMDHVMSFDRRLAAIQDAVKKEIA